MYWNAQNETEHTSPDWKLHVSCDLNDINKAWNLIAALFIDYKCEIGMKATILLNNNEWSELQRGREITIYIYRYHSSYKNYMQDVIPEQNHNLYLGSEFNDIYNSSFWVNFILEIENKLKLLNIKSRGVANGDLLLPGCIYVSLRNEAYIPSKDSIEIININSTNHINSIDSNNLINPVNNKVHTYFPLIYPPNEMGWNAAKHPNPFLEIIFFLYKLSQK